MASSKAATPEAYLAEMPADRRASAVRVRDVVDKAHAHRKKKKR